MVKVFGSESSINFAITSLLRSTFIEGFGSYLRPRKFETLSSSTIFPLITQRGLSTILVSTETNTY